MKTLIQTLTVLMSLSPIFSGLSQTQPYTTPSNLVEEIHSQSIDDSNEFEVRNLTPSVPGAYFSHLWWSGDNDFSFAARPRHNHRLVPNASPEVKMTDITTESYGSGGPPPLTYHFRTQHTGDAFPSPKILTSSTNIYVQHYRNAVIRDTMYMIITYGNYDTDSLNGTIKIDVGDHATIWDATLQKNPHFLPNGELWDSGKQEITFQNLKQFHERSILIPVYIKENDQDTLEMHVDIYEFNPPEGGGTVGVDFFKIAPTVAHSHDPNQMIEHSNAKNQCDYRGGKIHYTVKFQNEGEGKTEYIRVECYFDDKVDLNSITGIKVPTCFDSCAAHPIKGSYHKDRMNICSYWQIDHAKRMLTLEMHNIFLYNINDPKLPCIDMARDQIEFDILVKDNYLFGPPVLAYSKIYFDDNDPITTNIAVTGCSSPVPLDLGGGFQCKDQSFICKFKWYILGGILGLILLLLILLARKRKLQRAVKK